jgi:hypothetical protein
MIYTKKDLSGRVIFSPVSNSFGLMFEKFVLRRGLYRDVMV